MVEPALEVVVAGAQAAGEQLLELQVADQALVGGGGAVAFGGVEVALGGGAEGGGIDGRVLLGQGPDLGLSRAPDDGGQRRGARAKRQ